VVPYGLIKVEIQGKGKDRVISKRYSRGLYGPGGNPLKLKSVCVNMKDKAHTWGKKLTGYTNPKSISKTL